MAENVLREIAESLRPQNWTQGTLKDGSRMCALGHLRSRWGLSLDDGCEMYEDSMPVDYVRQRELLSQAAIDKFPDQVGVARLKPEEMRWAIVRLNDAEGVHTADVRQVFELAADRWDVERDG